MSTDKEPKRWECIVCSHENKKCRTNYFRMENKQCRIQVCYKCGGTIKESAEWLEWHGRMVERTRPGMLAMTANGAR